MIDNSSLPPVEVANQALINQLKKLSEDLAGLGVRRQQKLDQLIESLQSAEEAIDTPSGYIVTGKYARELVEAYQLSPIERWATTSLRSAAPNTWERILRDSSDLAQARRQTDPRNWQYELHLTSRLLSSDLDAIWPNCAGTPDIRVSMDGQEIAIEAKRPAQEGSVDKNVSNAIDQLFRSTLRNEPNAVGLVAISLDLCLLGRFMKPANGKEPEIYQCPIGDNEEIVKPFLQICEQLIELPSMKTLKMNSRIAGVMFTACYPAWLRRPAAAPKLCVVNRTAFPIASSAENKELLWNLVHRLRTQSHGFE